MLKLLGSQAGFLLVVIIGMVILSLFRKRKNKEEMESCLTYIFAAGFIFWLVCWLLFILTEPVD